VYRGFDPLSVPHAAVQLQQVDSIPLAVIRRQVSRNELSRVVPESCGLVWKAIKAQGAKGGRHVAIYWDSSIRLEVGVELHGPFAEQVDVVRSATPGGPVATVTHLGPYGGLSEAHDAIRHWCKVNGHQLAGPNWEIYGHWTSDWDDHPSRIRTDVFYQVAQSPAAS
jgi:effector-binding domain-containing protein